MMITRYVAAGVLAAALLSGCGVSEKALQEKLGVLSEENKALATRIEKLEGANRLLRTELKQVGLDSEDELQAVVRATADLMLDDMIQEKIDEKIGSQAEIDTIFETAVAEEVAAYEARKQEERTAERERRRQQWADQRAQWEARRTQRMAEDLQLTDEQAEQMAAASKEVEQMFRDAMQQMREGEGFSMGAAQKALEDIRVRNEERLAGFLDEQQMESYRKSRHNNLGFMSQLMQGFGGGRLEGGGQ